jgi:signal transduction histidine kinase
MKRARAKVYLIDLTKSTPAIKIDVDKMMRVFINLIKNAIDAMPNGGKLTITSKKMNDKVKLPLLTRDWVSLKKI